MHSTTLPEVAEPMSANALVTDDGKGGAHSGVLAQSKRSLLVSCLSREGGSPVDELIASTGWLPHTVRAALSRLRKDGIEVERTKRGDGPVTKSAAAQWVFLPLKAIRRSRLFLALKDFGVRAASLWHRTPTGERPWSACEARSRTAPSSPTLQICAASTPGAVIKTTWHCLPVGQC